MKNIKLIVGLGNPGKSYANNRHNFGYMVVDSLVQKLKLEEISTNKNYEAAIWRPKPDEKILIVKPLTFMNNSGLVVSELMRFFKIGEDETVVIHDDLDLPLGTVRMRQGGGSGGHRGVESINLVFGNDNFKRIKLGINRPPEHLPVEDYVLQNFSKDEQNDVDKVVDQVGQIVLQLCSGEKEFTEETINLAASL
jgi:PTH1 family peptidyl-tRNA hydrolase